MATLLVDFITSLDGYASAEGWPGWWGLEGPEYLAWLGEQPEVTYLMGAKTYQVMSGFAAGQGPTGEAELRDDEEESIDGLTRALKVVFSSSLEEPLTWANTTLVREDPVAAVRAMLGMLVRKKVLKQRRDGKRYLYRPATPVEKASRSALSSVMETFFGGQPDKVMATLLDVSENLTVDDLDRMKQLIDQARKEKSS